MVIIGCGSRDSKIIGKWIGSYYEVLTDTVQGYKLTIEFFKDKTCVMTAHGDFARPAKWVILKDGRIKITQDDVIIFGKLEKGTMTLDYFGYNAILKKKSVE